MITEITYQHFCNLGALCNDGCFSRYDNKAKKTRYYYNGNLSDACWMGWKLKSPTKKT